MSSVGITLSDLVERGGAYVGIAAFFGMAILAILYFAQARDLKRLREWAGRAPERALEVEQRVIAQAEARRTGGPQPAVAQQPAAAGVATAARPAAATQAAAPAALATAVHPPASAGAQGPPAPGQGDSGNGASN